MENKKKKGFTLIELLAIIVILAIIAVITVPIILNIIDNSRKGAAQDSAYGYKDAVNKYYVSELSSNRELQLEGQYTVTDGVLNGTGIVNKEIPVSGDKPSSGYLNYTNNTLTTGCLTIGDYKVTFENGSVSSTEKGTCSSSSEQGSTTPTTVKPVIYESKGDTETKTVSYIEVGDYVKIGDDGFYVINPDKDGNVVLMSEYNISNTAADSSDSTTTGYNAQNNGIMLMSNRTYLADGETTSETSTWRQAYTKIATPGGTSTEPDSSYYITAFSEEYYWKECIATSAESYYSCDAPYRNLYTNEAYGFIYGSYSNLYTPMENYKDYLRTITGHTLTVRPMSYSEAENLFNYPYDWAYNQSYWLGSQAGSNSEVWCVNPDDYLYRTDYYYNCGVRPVIEFPIFGF